MLRHLAVCQERQGVTASADEGTGNVETLYHLRVQDVWQGDYWLNLEMRGSATLRQLDDYLRAIWLECCGHLSRFSFGGWGDDDVPMGRRAERVFKPGVTLIHQYDFGTTSETQVKVVAERKGKATSTRPIALMARNLPSEERCIECAAPAEWLCMECLYEDDVWGTLCDGHAEEHPHDDYDGLFPLVNSPRMGMCGYEGPAEPPY
jgi:hypothetical protein